MKNAGRTLNLMPGGPSGEPIYKCFNLDGYL